MNEIWKIIPIADNYEASNLGKIRNSQKEIGIELGYNPSVISNCCNNHIKSAYGYKWILLDNGGDEE